MNWFTLLMRNFKLILITLGVSALITSAVWLYFHGKEVASMQLTIQHLESQVETEKKVRDILNEVTLENLETKQEIINAQRNAIKELQNAKETDPVVGDYYDQSYPDRLRTIRERARCVSMPYLCDTDGGEQNSKD